MDVSNQPQLEDLLEQWNKVREAERALASKPRSAITLSRLRESIRDYDAALERYKRGQQQQNDDYNQANR